MIVFVFSIELNGAQWGWELLKKTHKAHEADTDVDTCSTLALPLTYAMATTIRMMTSKATSSDNPISHISTLSNSGRIPWQDVAILTDMFRFRLLIDRFCAWRRPEDQVEAWNQVADEALRQAVEDAERAADIAEVKKILQLIATQQNEYASEANRQRERPVRHPLPVEPKPDVQDRALVRL